ncbi:MAG: ABC transporter ATP-binding protein, partial [Solirubrobacteraceae bacterium]
MDEREQRDDEQATRAQEPIREDDLRRDEEARRAEHDTGNVRVTDEHRDTRQDGADHEDEFKWHTGEQRDSGAPDAVEFVEVHKAFGRNKILRGLNLGLPEGKISMILGPSGTGKSVCIKHMVG